MKTLKQARRYARMFLNSVGTDAAGKALEELAVARVLMEKSGDFNSLLTSPVFSPEEKKSALSSLSGTLGFSEGTVKFLTFLAQENAAYGLGQILDKAVAIYSESMGRVKAMVFTPSLSLGREFEDRISKALKGMTSREVDVEFSEDPSLIGGVLIKVGSTMLDGSIKGQLRLLKEELIKG
jgi:F-type H+-transporting ATPase subunit delta